MTDDPTLGQIARIKESIIANKPHEAAADVDALIESVRQHSAGDTSPIVEASLLELRDIAKAALTGTRLAAEQIEAIISAARSLQTYDSAGNRRIDSVIAEPTHRF